MPQGNDRFLDFSSIIDIAKVQADRDKLQQMLINIVRNAFEASTDKNTVNLFISKEIAKKQICIHVRNSGEPIPPEILLQLTQPFFSRKTSGTGLGLAICRRIMEMHHGKLEIQSNLMEGTTVTIKLPMCD